MDIERLRKFATNLRDEFDGHTHAIGVDVLRILDAFEAMERERWFIDISPTMGTWYAMGGEGSVITEGHKTPLAALLAAEPWRAKPMLFNASDMNVLRKKIARCDELAERMMSAEAAGDQTDAAGAGLAFDAEMEWLGPECVTFCKQAIDEGIVRKAAAFDRLAAQVNENQDFCLTCYEGDVYVTVGNRAGGFRTHGPTLLEAIEQLPEANHESK